MSDPIIIVSGKQVNRAVEGALTFFAPRPSDGLEGEEATFEGIPADGPSVESEPTDTDPPKVGARVSNPANAVAVQAAAQKLADAIPKLTEKINALADTTIINFPNGQSMTGAELKTLWGKVDFTITDDNYGTDRGGASLGFRSEINFETTEGYFVHGPPSAGQSPGAAFLILHELSHLTVAGADYNALQWLAHRSVSLLFDPTLTDLQILNIYNRTSQQFINNEQFANKAALDILSALDLNHPNITPGFPVFGIPSSN